jgi:ribonuclease-3
VSEARTVYTRLEAALGTGLSPGLLEQALTHRSYAYENGGLPTNERLEFLGDAVLGLIVTDALYATPRVSWPSCAPASSTPGRSPASPAR